MDQDYDTRGLPRSLMLGGATVVDDTTYNALGGPVQLTLGNGTTDRFGYYGPAERSIPATTARQTPATASAGRTSAR